MKTGASPISISPNDGCRPRFACLGWDGYPGKVSRFRGEGFIPDGTSDGSCLDTGFTAWKLRSKQAATQHHLELVIQPDKPDPNSKPWRIARNYQLFRYQLGCNASGEYPTKFNGGNFTFDPSLVGKHRTLDPDWRAWGGGSFTAQNQRLVHWPMLKTGDAEIVKPQLDYHRRALPSAIARVKTYYATTARSSPSSWKTSACPSPPDGAGPNLTRKPVSAGRKSHSAISGRSDRWLAGVFGIIACFGRQPGAAGGETVAGNFFNACRPTPTAR